MVDLPFEARPEAGRITDSADRQSPTGNREKGGGDSLEIAASAAGLFVGVRRENAQLAGMVGARRGEEPSRILRDASQAPNPEYARQAGEIRVSSRTLMNSPG